MSLRTFRTLHIRQYIIGCSKQSSSLEEFLDEIPEETNYEIINYLDGHKSIGNPTEFHKTESTIRTHIMLDNLHYMAYMKLNEHQVEMLRNITQKTEF